jgi:hypothetical protein
MKCFIAVILNNTPMMAKFCQNMQDEHVTNLYHSRIGVLYFLALQGLGPFFNSGIAVYHQ